jgi:type II secretion system protein H
MNNKRGFTLVEILVVIAIMGILMAIAIPAVTTWRENDRNKQVARDILAGLRQARSMAISQGEQIAVIFDPGTKTLSYDGTIIKTFPDHIVLESSKNSGQPIDPYAWSATEKIDTVFMPQGFCTDFLNARVNGNDRLTVFTPSLASGLARIK